MRLFDHNTCACLSLRFFFLSSGTAVNHSTLAYVDPTTRHISRDSEIGGAKQQVTQRDIHGQNQYRSPSVIESKLTAMRDIRNE